MYVMQKRGLLGGEDEYNIAMFFNVPDTDLLGISNCIKLANYLNIPSLVSVFSEVYRDELFAGLGKTYQAAVQSHIPHDLQEEFARDVERWSDGFDIWGILGI